MKLKLYLIIYFKLIKYKNNLYKTKIKFFIYETKDFISFVYFK